MSDYVIETRGLTKTYGEQNSVSNLSIHVRKGRIYGLLGRNGAGKTTTMRMLLGLTAPSFGDVKIFGKPLCGSEKSILPRIGSLIEAPGFYPNLTGTENLQIFADLRGLKSQKYIKGALEVVNLPYRDKKLFSQYSLGMKQRLAIALAVMHNPELLILDEPINGLDPIGIAEVRDFIRELCDDTGKTILISSHILSEISLLADDIGIIDHGVLLEEESLEELEAKNGKYFRFAVSNAALAANLLLMPAVVVLASNLLFEEQDNDTLKNLMTVPVSKPTLALAKMALLFLFSIAFMAVGGLVNLAIVLASGLEPVGFWKLFFVGIGQGIMMWAGALPCVLLVVLLNRSYIISVIITFFYTAVNYIFGTNDYFIMQPFGFNPGALLPGPLTFRWFFQYLDTSGSSAQMTELLERISPYFVTPPQAFLVVILESAVFLTLIALVYKRQSC